MTRPPGPRILLAGGGSGGSATPVLAVAQAIRVRCPDARFLYVGTLAGPERALAAEQRIPFVAIQTGKLRRYWDWQNLTDPARVLAGVGQAYRVARHFHADAAFAAGGFASVPPIVGAWLNRARVVIHQQDVEPGLANRILVPFARRITVSMADSAAFFPRGRSTVTGNPVRREVLQANPSEAYRALDLEPGVPVVVATGGGTGAMALNRLMAAAAERLVGQYQVVHLTGAGRGVPSAAGLPRYRQVEFLTRDMPHLLAASSVVLSRAGMGTLTELAALERAALIVPMPRSHQWANAHAFEAQGAIEVADQDLLSVESLVQRLLTLLDDPARRAALGKALGRSMPRDAAERIAEEVLDAT